MEIKECHCVNLKRKKVKKQGRRFLASHISAMVVVRYTDHLYKLFALCSTVERGVGILLPLLLLQIKTDKNMLKSQKQKKKKKISHLSHFYYIWLREEVLSVAEEDKRSHKIHGISHK